MTSNWNDMHFDILKEIGNIGSGNAVTSLAKMLNRKVDMFVPNVNLVEFKDVADFIGGPESTIVGILVSISGDITGIMMFLMKMESAHALVEIVMNGMETSEVWFNEIELSALQEIGNIMVSSYFTSLAGLTSKSFIPSIPYLSIDMANAILSVPAIEFGKVSDRALFIETSFAVDQVNVGGYFVLVPDMPSFKTILSALGVE
ncbi:MAG: chemotaxis protein CheC [Clostridiales bacterium]|jgi:chemotaxis protein CheC|nr:chemotaxis protein CheC [Clostridiales bacterium]